MNKPLPSHTFDRLQSIPRLCLGTLDVEEPLTVLALVTNREEVSFVTEWALQVSGARGEQLSVLCWAYSPTKEFLLLADEEAQADVDELAKQVEATVASRRSEQKSAVKLAVRTVLSPDSTRTVIEHAREVETRLLIAGADDPSGASGGSYSTNPLLRQSPCNTFVLPQEIETQCTDAPQIARDQAIRCSKSAQEG